MKGRKESDLKVVNEMEDQDKIKDQDKLKEEGMAVEDKDPAKYVKVKRFNFIMGIFFLIFISAGVTTIALTFGDEKVQESIVNTRSEFNKLYEAFDTIKDEYYLDIKDEELVNGAINGMLDSLDDPYSDYMNEEETASFQERISSSFEGIGAEIQQKDNQIIVVSPIKGSPAEEAGLKANDIILSVDGESLEGLSSTEAVSLIRGEKGSKVKLSIKRGEADPFEVEITRDTIPVDTVYAEMREGNVAHIQVTSFSEHTSDELMDALEEMESKGMKGLVLDFRGNPGGIMKEAIDIASLFVPKGETLFQVEYKNGSKDVIESENSSPFSFPVAILVDDGSASASEIVAAAVQETTNIPIVGIKTFGKGTVQTAKNLDDGSNLKYTSAKWLTPKGNWINEKGVKPDVTVELPDYAKLTYISPDEQLSVGTNTDDTKTAELMLEAVGYSPGKADGVFDESTKTAVSNLQKDAGLEITGVLTGDTTMLLMQKLSEKIQENDTQLEKATQIVLDQMK